jgi:hypothetical protein
MFRDAQPDLFSEVTQRRADMPPPVVAPVVTPGNADSMLNR